MSLQLVLRGFILGLAIAAPVGPIGVLCIRRTLAQGRTFGFVSGLGAATADAIYGCIAAFGLTAISALLVRQQDWLRLVGGLFLCYLGVRTLLARPTDQSAAAEGQGLGGAYFSTLLLTLTNPITILSFVAVFAGLGVGRAGNDYAAAAAIVLGVFLGSAAWWFLLSGGVSLVRDKFDARAMLWVNRISGVIILGFGLFALAGLTKARWQ
jgi:threonine/homoserine/homoserine lactone efflux protein